MVLYADLLGQRRAELQGRAIDVAAVGLVGARIILLVVNFDARRDAGAEEIRIRSRQVYTARVLAVGYGGADRVAGAQEIAVAHLDFGEHAVGRRVASGNREVAGRLLLHLDIEHDAILHRAWLARNLDRLEIVQVLEVPFGAIDQGLVVGVAFGNIE